MGHMLPTFLHVRAKQGSETLTKSDFRMRLSRSFVQINAQLFRKKPLLCSEQHVLCFLSRK
jgi:hypothetical protein